MKLFKITGIYLATTLIISMASCSPSEPKNWDDMETKSFDIADFKYIHLEGGFKVVLQQSEKQGLRIKADEDDFKYIDVEVRDSVLDIEIKDKHFTLDQIILFIDFKQLEKMNIEGGVKLETQGYVNLKNFLMKIEGGAKIEMDIKAEKLDVIGEGGVSFDLEGVCDVLTTKISGAGYFDGEDMKSKRVNITIEGVGGASVYATDYLDASISGIGKITYKGDPEVHKNVGGLGFISRD